jgi:hypothetical protein
VFLYLLDLLTLLKLTGHASQFSSSAPSQLSHLFSLSASLPLSWSLEHNTVHALTLALNYSSSNRGKTRCRIDLSWRVPVMRMDKEYFTFVVICVIVDRKQYLNTPPFRTLLCSLKCLRIHSKETSSGTQGDIRLYKGFSSLNRVCNKCNSVPLNYEATNTNLPTIKWM